jgi:hypothetical protein
MIHSEILIDTIKKFEEKFKNLDANELEEHGRSLEEITRCYRV